MSFSKINRCGADRKTLRKDKHVRIIFVGLVALEKSQHAWISIVNIKKAATLAGVDCSMQVCRTHLIMPDPRSSLDAIVITRLCGIFFMWMCNNLFKAQSYGRSSCTN